MNQPLLDRTQLSTPNLGRVVTMTIDNKDLEIIGRYRRLDTFKSIQAFAKEVIQSTVRWMERMINGSCLFELDSMDDWKYDRELNQLKLIRKSSQRSTPVVFDMEFCSGTLEQYNQGLATIISSFWYKTHAMPPVVIELIACCDLLYREHHNGTSPAASARVSHTDVSQLPKVSRLDHV